MVHSRAENEAMGSFHHFRCEGCGYEAEVCGGSDGGLTFMAQTAYCPTCRELVDVITGYFMRFDYAGEEIDRRGVNQCSHCGCMDHTPWIASDGCPRCGSVMVNEGSVLDWEKGAGRRRIWG
jgi:uncharacterized paraquat-inducible protein A